MSRSSAAVFLLAIFVSPGTGNSAPFKWQQQFSSEAEYERARNPRRPSKRLHGVEFGNKARVSLRSHSINSEGKYEEDALIGEERVLIKKTTTQFESLIQSVDVYDLDGSKLGEIPGAERFWTSPRGDVIVVAEQTQTAPTYSTGKLRIYNGSGKLVAQPELSQFPSWGDASVIFSETGATFIYILNGLKDRADSPKKTGVAILKVDGTLLGQYSAQDWTALSGGLLSKGRRPLTGRATIFETQKRVLLYGRDSDKPDPALVCLDFSGRLLWSREMKTGPMVITVQADPDEGDFAVVELGDKTTISTHDLSSGKPAMTREAPVSLPAGVRPKIDRKGKLLAISGAGLRAHGATRNAIIVDTEGSLKWTDEGDDPSARISFDERGQMILRKGEKVYVGEIR